MSYSTMGDVPDIFRRTNVVNGYEKKRREVEGMRQQLVFSVKPCQAMCLSNCGEMWGKQLSAKLPRWPTSIRRIYNIESQVLLLPSINDCQDVVQTFFF